MDDGYQRSGIHPQRTEQERAAAGIDRARAARRVERRLVLYEAWPMEDPSTITPPIVFLERMEALVAEQLVAFLHDDI